MSKAQKTIYFIPGTMCDERLWTGTWNELSSLLVDYTFEHLTIPSLKNIDEITSELSKKLPDNSYLVGFSLGGYIASNMALNFPNKVNKLLLIANMSSALPEKEIKERSRTIQWIEANGYNGIPDKRIHHLLHPDSHDNKNIIQTIKDMDATLGKDLLLHQLNVTTQRKNLLPELFHLLQPIKFLIGDTDKLVNIKKISDQMKQSKDHKNQINKSLEVVKNSGHMLPLEQPTYLAKTIVHWLLNKA